ncbi:hypothetical protein KR074_005907 [Drosophila pseudoananassae]|nr:hypothetical protein KR074_005907 [Drosophila pseudoananassae]
MAQFVTHIQPTLLEASQGHVPHHHGHQVGVQHSSHLPHSGHNMPSPPTAHNHHHGHGHGHSSAAHHSHPHKQSKDTHHTSTGHTSKKDHHSPPSQVSSPPAEHHADHVGHYEYFQHQHEVAFHHEGGANNKHHQQQQQPHHHHSTNKHEHCPTGHQSAVSPA